jgi:hypothetical protein
MLSRYAVPLLVAAAIAFACAPRPHAEATATSAETRTSLATKAAAPDAAKPPRLTKAMREEIERHPLAASVNVAIRNVEGSDAGTREVTLALHVTNRGEKQVELMFPSGQTHDTRRRGTRARGTAASR